jgi:hypothetical protein
MCFLLRQLINSVQWFRQITAGAAARSTSGGGKPASTRNSNFAAATLEGEAIFRKG